MKEEQQQHGGRKDNGDGPRRTLYKFLPGQGRHRAPSQSRGCGRLSWFTPFVADGLT